MRSHPLPVMSVGVEYNSQGTHTPGPGKRVRNKAEVGSEGRTGAAKNGAVKSERRCGGRGLV